MPALTPAQPWVHETDDGERFMLRPLTRAQYCSVVDMEGVGAKSYEVVRLSLTGWENFNDADGKAVAFNVSDMSQNIDRLPVSLMMSLAADVMRRALLGPADRKN